MKLTAHQQPVADALISAVRQGQRIAACSGPGGVGKTVVAAYVCRALLKSGFYPIPCAITGKATSRFQAALAQQGVELEARTASAICERVVNTEDGPVFMAKKNPNLPDNAVLVADEFSMMGKRYLQTKFLPATEGLPVLGFGDHFQLPPVMDQDNPFLARTKLHLSEILRQDGASGIVSLSQALRTTGVDVYNRNADEANPGIMGFHSTDVAVVPTISMPRAAATLFTSPDRVDSPVLVGNNDLRVKVNRVARARFGFHGPPQAGETIRVERNNSVVRLFNGDQVRIEEVLDVTTLDGESASLVKLEGREDPLWLPHLSDASKVWDEPSVLVWDYGYATTIHKAQGSEWEHVRVLIDPHLAAISTSLPGRRMLYTAFTRARRLLDVFVHDYEYDRARAAQVNRLRSAARSRAKPRKGRKADTYKQRLKELL